MDLLMYFFDVIIFVGIFGILALSLNLEFGFTGLVNFGKVAFFLVGAYVFAVMARFGIPLVFCFLGGALLAAALGLAVSLPALRLRLDYLAIATLALGEILRIVVKAERWIAGGVWGTPVPAAVSWAGASNRALALGDAALVYFCLILSFVFLQYLTNSPYGRVIRAIREDEIAAEALGKDRLKYKAQVFMLGSALAGLAGGLYAQHLRFISPDMFMPMVTFWAWTMIILGGPANTRGALLGALVVEVFIRGTRIAKDFVHLPVDPYNLQYILLGLAVILVLMYRPQGLLKESEVKTKAKEVALARAKSSGSS